MGTCSSQDKSLPLNIHVAHLTPSSFPLIPTFNRNTIKVCKKSWETLLLQTYKSSQTGLDTASITVFYNEFYRKLYLFDTEHKFDAVLSKNVTGGYSNIAGKGAIIVRIVKFALTLQDDDETRERLKKLGKSHSLMGIEGWQYSVFVEILLNTIAKQLGGYATHDVMSCWVNLFAFLLQYMLPSALQGRISGYDCHAVIHTKHIARDMEMGRLMAEEGIYCSSDSKKSRLESLKEDILEESEEKLSPKKPFPRVHGSTQSLSSMSSKSSPSRNNRIHSSIKITTTLNSES